MMSHHEPLSARLLRACGEGLLIGLATLSAWPFAGIEPYPEYLLTLGVLLLAGCWAGYVGVTGWFRFRHDLVSTSLAGLILLTSLQLLPLPVPVVKVLSPARAGWHESFVPEQLETLPGESARPRPGLILLTVNPHATRTLAAQLLALFAVYAAARNWLANRHSVRRFAWAAMINGVLLALLALGQFFSSPGGVAFWQIQTGGAIYGPFVCRNHYPDFLAFGIGGAVYLLHPPPGARKKKKVGDTVRERLVALLDIFDRPASLAAAFALGLMIASIPFSQSRGGVIAVALAGVGVAVLGRGKGQANTAVTAIVVVGVVVVGLFLWLGIGPIANRFHDDGKTLDDRTPLWANVAQQVPGLWGGGCGGGTFVWIEPINRVSGSAVTVYEHAHNEYLQAVLEGGVVRLALTLALAVGVPVVLGRACVRLRGRSMGAFILGGWFAVVVLALHSAVDFAIHLPAVALVAAATTGMAMGVSGQTPVRRSESGLPADPNRGRLDAPLIPLDRVDDPDADTDPPTHPPADGPQWKPLVLPLLLTLVVAVVALDARTRWRAERFRLAGLALSGADTVEGLPAPEILKQYEQRIAFLRSRTAITPADPGGWADLAQAHLDAAQLWERAADGRFDDQTAADHIRPALTALRKARELCPLYPEVHFRLGLYARYFERTDRSEPPLAHFRRASRLLPSDPDVWYACGVEEQAAGKRADAEASWKRSLQLGLGRVQPILKATLDLPPQALRDRVLPDDPAVLMAAADDRFPDREKQAGERRVFVEPAAAAAGRAEWTVPQATATANACEELGRVAEAVAVWEKATQVNRGDRGMRDAAARWLEQQERYADALPHLEWLSRQLPNDARIRDRLTAARHGAELKGIIGK